MMPLFQLFEITYTNGLLFYDRSGMLSRRLQEMLPGLAFKSAVLDQRDFTLPNKDLELFYGIALARIQSLAPNDQDFPSTAANFLQIITEVLEITQLKEFHFRYVLGRPCGSEDEAQKLMWPLIPEETKQKMTNIVEPPKWQAIQGEFLLGNLACQSRIAIVYLVPHQKFGVSDAKSDQPIPHITFHLDLRGLAPMDVAGFDAESFIKNARDRHSGEILAKLAPHLT